MTLWLSTSDYRAPYLTQIHVYFKVISYASGQPQSSLWPWTDLQDHTRELLRDGSRRSFGGHRAWWRQRRQCVSVAVGIGIGIGIGVRGSNNGIAYPFPIGRCRRSLASRFAHPQRHGARRDESATAAVRGWIRAARIEQREQRRGAIEPRWTFRICRRVERRPRSATLLGQFL